MRGEGPKTGEEMAKENAAMATKVRAGCGALFGLFVPFGVYGVWHGGSFGSTIVIVVVSSVVCAVLAAKFGDTFWESRWWRH